MYFYMDVRVVVECDDHEYHERTKQQAIRDKTRDRAFQAQGFQVLRFTGSEIWRDALKCAAEVFNAANKEIDRRIDREHAV
jgi:very-short-patch-repair endonuclease